MSSGDAGALQFQECPGVPVDDPLRNIGADPRQYTDAATGIVPADLMSFEGFKPERGDSPDDYEGKMHERQAAAIHHRAEPPYNDPDYVPPRVEPVSRACTTCMFFEPHKAECRKSPPVRLPRRFDATATSAARIRDEQLLWGWPEVKPDDWCGAWEEYGAEDR